MNRSTVLAFLTLFVLQSAWAETHFEEPKTEAQLRVVTYNHGLLNFRNPIRSVYVPFKKARSQAAPQIWSDFLDEHQPDAVLLQEIWYRKDYRRLERAFRLRGYSPVVTDEQVPRYKKCFGIRGHGLQIFLRDESLELVSQEFRPFQDGEGKPIRAELEKLKILTYEIDVKRGALVAKVRLRNSSSPTQVTLVTTHLTSRLEDQSVRNAQIQSLAELLLKLDTKTDSLVLGADFNISPTFERAPEKEREDYWVNAEQYSVFLQKSGMLDSYRSAKEVQGYQFTQNREHNILAKIGKSTKSEPEQRLDYVFLKHAEAQSYQTVLSENLVRIPGRVRVDEVPMSDHFGVMVEMQLPQVHRAEPFPLTVGGVL